MKLEFAFLADAATVLEKGVFDVIGGGFDVVTGMSFPATKYAMVLIGRVLFDAAECGKEYEFSGEIVDAGGKAIFPKMRGALVPPQHPRDPKRSNWMTVCLNCQGVIFPTPGDYFFRLSIGDVVVGQVIIEAVVEENPT